MKILTFNVHGWETAKAEPNLDLVTDLLGNSNADVISLNEVWHPWPFASEGALVTLARRLNMAYAFGLVAAAQTAAGQTLPYGNALLSRWPIVAHASHRLPAGSYGVPRGLFEVRLSSPAGRAVTVYVTHLDHRSESARIEQWTAAQSWLVRERSSIHILLGDFNALALSDYATLDAIEALQEQQLQRGWPAPSFDLTGRVLAAGYRDAFAAHGQGSGATWPARAPERRVDYIFVPSGTLPVVSCCRWDGPSVELASDHRPVLASLAID